MDLMVTCNGPYTCGHTFGVHILLVYAGASDTGKLSNGDPLAILW